jgi:hypothetical protein
MGKETYIYANFMKLIIAFMYAFVSSCVLANDDAGGLESLQNAYSSLEGNIASEEARAYYLESFPNNAKSFKEIFCMTDHTGLYSNSYQYIHVLDELSKYHEHEVGRLLINLGSELRWEPDAVAHLQHALARYAANHTKTFSIIMNSELTDNEVKSVIAFIANVENFAYYPEYTLIINNLYHMGDDELSTKFRIAKDKRIRAKTH